MKIDRVQIDGFGHFESFSLDLGPGLNVVFGPNEAGKSTMLAFIRAVLFGFGKRSQANRYEPAKGPFGGELFLSTRSGPLVVRRTGAKRADGELSVRTPDGEARPAAQLSDALCGISRELFCEVFAFGLSELSSFERLAEQGGVSQALFAAAIQGGQRYPEVAEGLRKATEARFSQKGAKKELNELLRELGEVQDSLRAIGNRPAAYAELMLKREALDAQAQKLEQKAAAAAADREAAGRLRAALPELAALDAAEAERAGLPPLSDFPPDALARLEERLRSVAQAQAELARATEEAERAAARTAELAPVPEVAEVADELQAALEAYSGRAPQLRALVGKRAAVLAKKRQLGKSLDELGLGLDADALVDVELGAAAKNRLATVRDEISDADRVHRERDQAYQKARADREKAEGDIRRLTSEQQRTNQAPASAVRRMQAALTQLPQLKSEAERLEADAQDRRRRAEELRAVREPLPVALLPASAGWGATLGLATVVAVAAVGFGRGAAIGAGVACAAAAAGLFWVQRRAARVQAAALAAHRERQLATRASAERLEGEARTLLERAQDRRVALAESASKAQAPADQPAAWEARAEALAAQLKDVERREGLSRELESISSALASAVAMEKSAQADRDVAAARGSKLSRVLEALTSERRFPEGLNAERALDLWSQAADVKQRLLDLRAEQEALSAEERASAEVGEALLALALRAGLHPVGAEAAAPQAKALLEGHRRKDDQRKAAAAKADALAAQCSRAQELASQAHRALVALYAEAACADEAGLRRAASQAGRVQSLEREARERRLKVEALCLVSVDEAKEEIHRAGGPAAVAGAVVALEAKVSELAASRAAAIDERGRLRQQLEAWESDEQVAQLREREETLSARAAQGGRAYAVDRIGLLLLSKARERYQEAHQPRVCKLASRILSELTAGKYVRVQAAEDGRELRVRDSTGQERAAEDLSRGTREQLYLAFRLAVVEDFGETLAPLPIVLDDILVNFDLDRTRYTLGVLARLSQRHQVVAFTCHPSLKEAFRAQGAGVVELAPRQQALLRLQAG